MNNYYKPSGKFSLKSIIFFLVLCITAFPLLGLAYAYCIWYIPFVYINFIIAAIFAFIVGSLINGFVVKKGKVRNSSLALVFGLVGGLIALYFHWAAWADLVYNAGESYGTSRIGITISNVKLIQAFHIATDPAALFNFIKEVNEYGTWGIRGATISGVYLSIVWVIEFIIIVGIATMTPISRSKQPFCELENDWYEENDFPAFNFIEDKAKMVVDLENVNEQVFSKTERVENLESDHSLFTLYTSKNNKSYLSIKNMKAKEDKKGKLEFERDGFIEYISISNSLKESLKAK